MSLEILVRLQRIAELLFKGRCLKYPLIESYYFEIASLDPDLGMTYSLSQMLEPLQSIKDIIFTYIRVMRCDYWDLIQPTEWKMCNGSTMKRPSIADTLTEEPSKSKEPIVQNSNEGYNTEDVNESDSEDETQEVGDLENPESEEAQELFKILHTKPMYRSTMIVRKVRDGMPEDEIESLS